MPSGIEIGSSTGAPLGCNVSVSCWIENYEEIEEGVRSSGTFSTEPEIKQEASKRFTLNSFVPDVRSIVKERSGAKEVAAEKDFLVTDQGVMVETNAGLVSAEDLFITRRQKKNLEDVDESETLRAAFTSIISSPTAEVYFPVHNKTDGVDQVRYVSHWKREGNKVKAKMIRIDEGGTDKSMKDAHTIISELVGDGFTETRRSERHYVFSKIQHPAEGVRGSFPAGTDRVEKEGHIAPLPPVEVITPPAEEPIGVKKDISQTPHGEPALMRSQPESNGVRKTVVSHTAHSLVDDVSEMGYQVAEDIHETVGRAVRTIREIAKQRSVRNEAARGEEVPALFEPVVLQGTHRESGNGIVGSRTDTRRNDAVIEPRHFDRIIFSQADRIMLEKTWQDVREKQTVITFAHHTGTGIGAALVNIHVLAELRLAPMHENTGDRRMQQVQEAKIKNKAPGRVHRRTEGAPKPHHEKRPGGARNQKTEGVSVFRRTVRSKSHLQTQTAKILEKTEVSAYTVLRKRRMKTARTFNKETMKRSVPRKEKKTGLYVKPEQPKERKRRRSSRRKWKLFSEIKIQKQTADRERPIRRLKKESGKRKIVKPRGHVRIIFQNARRDERTARERTTVFPVSVKRDTLRRIERTRTVKKNGIVIAREHRTVSVAGVPLRVRDDSFLVAEKPRNGFHREVKSDHGTIISFRFAFILWHVLSSPLQLHSKNNRMHPDEDILPENTGSPWVLLAVISYLAALREQGIAPMIVYTVPVIQIPRTGTIFLYQSWYDENTYG